MSIWAGGGGGTGTVTNAAINQVVLGQNTAFGYLMPYPNGTDDTTAIQASENSSAARIIYREGTYIVSSAIMVPNAAKYRDGQGRGLTTLQLINGWNPTFPYFSMFNFPNGAPRGGFSKMTIDCNAVNGVTPGNNRFLGAFIGAALTNNMAIDDIEVINGGTAVIGFGSSGTVTNITSVSVATPGVFNAPAHGFAQGQELAVRGTTFPAPFVNYVTYYANIIDADNFSLASVAGDVGIATTTSGSGVTVLSNFRSVGWKITKSFFTNATGSFIVTNGVGDVAIENNRFSGWNSAGGTDLISLYSGAADNKGVKIHNNYIDNTAMSTYYCIESSGLSPASLQEVDICFNTFDARGAAGGTGISMGIRSSQIIGNKHRNGGYVTRCGYELSLYNSIVADNTLENAYMSISPGSSPAGLMAGNTIKGMTFRITASSGSIVNCFQIKDIYRSEISGFKFYINNTGTATISNLMVWGIYNTPGVLQDLDIFGHQLFNLSGSPSTAQLINWVPSRSSGCKIHGVGFGLSNNGFAFGISNASTSDLAIGPMNDFSQCTNPTSNQVNMLGSAITVYGNKHSVGGDWNGTRQFIASGTTTGTIGRYDTLVECDVVSAGTCTLTFPIWLNIGAYQNIRNSALSGGSGVIAFTPPLFPINRAVAAPANIIAGQNLQMQVVQKRLNITSVNTTTGVITAVNHRLIVGQQVLFDTNPTGVGAVGVIPTGLVAGTIYTVTAVPSGSQINVMTEVATGTACTVTTNVLTVGGTVVGVFAVGQTVVGGGGSLVTIASLGTGTGGAGTYNLSGSPGSSGTFVAKAGLAIIPSAAGTAPINATSQEMVIL